MELNYSHFKKEYDQLVETLATTTEPQKLAQLGKRQSELFPIVQKIDRLEKIKAEIADHEKLIADKSELAKIRRGKTFRGTTSYYATPGSLR
jgi:protein subunit release factor A